MQILWNGRTVPQMIDLNYCCFSDKCPLFNQHLATYRRGTCSVEVTFISLVNKHKTQGTQSQTQTKQKIKGYKMRLQPQNEQINKNHETY